MEFSSLSTTGSPDEHTPSPTTHRVPISHVSQETISTINTVRETSPIPSTSGKTSSMPVEMSTLSPDPQVTDLSPSWVGFKIVGDNINKTVCPRHQTLSSRTQSLYYFHAFAVQDRIDASNMSDSKPNLDLSSLPYIHSYSPLQMT